MHLQTIRCLPVVAPFTLLFPLSRTLISEEHALSQSLSEYFMHAEPPALLTSVPSSMGDATLCAHGSIAGNLTKTHSHKGAHRYSVTLKKRLEAL